MLHNLIVCLLLNYGEQYYCIILVLGLLINTILCYQILLAYIYSIVDLLCKD